MRTIISVILSMFICSTSYSGENGIDGYQDIKFNMTQKQIVSIIKNRKNYIRNDEYRVRYDTQIMGYNANVGINFLKDNKEKIENIDIKIEELAEDDIFLKFSRALMTQYPQAKATEIITNKGYIHINKEQSIIFYDGSSITLNNSKNKRDFPEYGFIVYKPKPVNLGL